MYSVVDFRPNSILNNWTETLYVFQKISCEQWRLTSVHLELFLLVSQIFLSRVSEHFRKLSETFDFCKALNKGLSDVFIDSSLHITDTWWKWIWQMIAKSINCIISFQHFLCFSFFYSSMFLSLTNTFLLTCQDCSPFVETKVLWHTWDNYRIWEFLYIKHWARRKLSFIYQFFLGEEWNRFREARN